MKQTMGNTSIRPLFITGLSSIVIVLVGLSLLLPASISEDSGNFVRLIDRMARILIFHANELAQGSDHPLAITVTYLVSIGFSVACALSLALTIIRMKANINFRLDSAKSMSSPLFSLLGGGLILAAPFLPLLPMHSTQIFHPIQEAIRHSRLSLAFWNVILFLGYFGVLFAVVLQLLVAIRRKRK